MTMEIGLVFLLVAGALYLFASQRLPLDVSALTIMVALLVIPIVGDPVVRHTPGLRDLGIDLLPLVLTVMFAASTSFLTPVGYQTSVMVFGTGLNEFTDFARVGAPLNAILAMHQHRDLVVLGRVITRGGCERSYLSP